MPLSTRALIALILFILAAVLAGLGALNLLQGISNGRLILLVLCLACAGLAVRL